MSFRYDASAAALGGFFTRPHTEPLTVQAPSVLAPVGGYGSARVENFRFEGIVSFSAARTDVSGTEHIPTAGPNAGVTVRETRVTAVIENLDILGQITADRVVSRLASEHPAGAPGAEASMLPLGSYFVNLRIAGVLIGGANGELHPRPDLVAADEADGRATMAFIRRACIQRQGLPDRGTRGATPFYGADGKPREPLRDVNGGPIDVNLPRLRLPLFDLSNYYISGATTQASQGGTIVIPQLGTITLGEFIVTPTERQLNMIVVELGSPDAGRLAAGPIRTNGSDL